MVICISSPAMITLSTYKLVRDEIRDFCTGKDLVSHGDTKTPNLLRALSSRENTIKCIQFVLLIYKYIYIYIYIYSNMVSSNALVVADRL